MNSSRNRVLVLNGSPIRGSNVDLISEKIVEGATAVGWTHEVIYLNDYTITPCQSCGVRTDDDICIYHDEIYPVFSKFSDCDAVVVASPVYFDSVSAQLKLFVDRCNCYRPLRSTQDGKLFIETRSLKKRAGIAVLVGGERRKHQQALTVIKGFLIWTGVRFIDVVYYMHDDWVVGGVKSDLACLQRAYELGCEL